MTLKVLRKIIKEQIELASKLQINNDLKDGILDDIEYIKKFSFIKHVVNQIGEIWKFEYKINDYLFNFYVKKDKNDSWSGELSVYWKEKTKNPTSGPGKDFQMNFGPYTNYAEFIKKVNSKFKNNPLISTKIYHDDWNANMDLLIKKLLLKLKKNIKNIIKIKNPYFRDLKKIYMEIKNIPDNNLISFIEIKAPTEADKQNIILTLQKLDKVTFYLGLEKMH